MPKRACKATKADGSPCRAAPLKDGDFCLSHDQEARQRISFGGAQPGAGRPAKPRAIDILTERLEREADKYLKPLEDALEATRAVVVGNGPAAYVEHVPDFPTRLRAMAEILDRVHGRPKQSTELSGPDGEPVAIQSTPDEPARHAAIAKALQEAGALAAPNGNGNGNGHH